MDSGNMVSFLKKYTIAEWKVLVLSFNGLYAITFKRRLTHGELQVLAAGRDSISYLKNLKTSITVIKKKYFLYPLWKETIDLN